VSGTGGGLHYWIKICEKTKATGSSTSVMYAELVAVGSTNPDKQPREWMSFETDETITYKVI